MAFSCIFGIHCLNIHHIRLGFIFCSDKALFWSRYILCASDSNSQQTRQSYPLFNKIRTSPILPITALRNTVVIRSKLFRTHYDTSLASVVPTTTMAYSDTYTKTWKELSEPDRICGRSNVTFFTSPSTTLSRWFLLLRNMKKIAALDPLNTKRRPLYLRPQSVPRCKHFSSGL